jgi:hypothetical protein
VIPVICPLTENADSTLPANPIFLFGKSSGQLGVRQ